MDRNFNKCTTCGEYHWTNEKCDPIYYVQIPDYHGDEWSDIRAKSHSDAVEKYCMLNDAGRDYDIINDGGLDVIFAKDAEGNIKKFSINAYVEPQYDAEEIVDVAKK